MRIENLKRFRVAESDEDLDSPLGVVPVLLEADLAQPLHACDSCISARGGEFSRTQLTIEGSRELLVDLVEKILEPRKPQRLSPVRQSLDSRKKRAKETDLDLVELRRRCGELVLVALELRSKVGDLQTKAHQSRSNVQVAHARQAHLDFALLVLLQNGRTDLQRTAEVGLRLRQLCFQVDQVFGLSPGRRSCLQVVVGLVPVLRGSLQQLHAVRAKLRHLCRHCERARVSDGGARRRTKNVRSVHAARFPFSSTSFSATEVDIARWSLSAWTSRSWVAMAVIWSLLNLKMSSWRAVTM